MWRYPLRLAGRASYAVARRAAPQLTRTALQTWNTSRLGGFVRSASALNRNPTAWYRNNIAMRPMGASARLSRVRNMNTLAGAPRATVARGLSRRTAGMIAAGAGAAAAASGVYQNTRSKSKARQQKAKNSSQVEQIAIGDKGDDITTTDFFKSGKIKKIYPNQFLTTPISTIRNGSMSSIICAKNGRAKWKELNTFKFATQITSLFNQTTLNYRNNNAGDTSGPTWHKGDDLLNTAGFLDQSFIYDSLKYKISFTNQSSCPIHLEYYIISPKNSSTYGYDWYDAFKSGYLDSNAGVTDPFALTDSTEKELPMNVFFSDSALFMKLFNIKYKKKVRMAEGGVHNFTYIDNTNKIFKMSTFNTTSEIRYTSDIIIARVCGTWGDTSPLITTQGDITTGLTKVIYRTDIVEAVRHSFAAPKIHLDNSQTPVSESTVLYQKDPNTGAKEDIDLE